VLVFRSVPLDSGNLYFLLLQKTLEKAMADIGVIGLAVMGENLVLNMASKVIFAIVLKFL